MTLQKWLMAAHKDAGEHELFFQWFLQPLSMKLGLTLAWCYLLGLGWMRQWTKLLVQVQVTVWCKKMLLIGHIHHLEIKLGLFENFLWAAKSFQKLGRSWLPKRLTSLGPVPMTAFLFPLVPGWHFLLSVPILSSHLSFSSHPITWYHWISYLHH